MQRFLLITVLMLAWFHYNTGLICLQCDDGSEDKCGPADPASNKTCNATEDGYCKVERPSSDKLKRSCSEYCTEESGTKCCQTDLCNDDVQLGEAPESPTSEEEDPYSRMTEETDMSSEDMRFGDDEIRFVLNTGHLEVTPNLCMIYFSTLVIILARQ